MHSFCLTAIGIPNLLFHSPPHPPHLHSYCLFSMVNYKVLPPRKLCLSPFKSPAVAVHTFDCSTPKAEEISEFKASLVYRVPG